MLTTGAIGYWLNILNKLTNYDSTYKPWYNLLAWVNEQENN
jgi:hypothetical protein